MKFRNIAVVSIAAAVSSVAIGTAGAQAAGLIGSGDILDNSVRSIDIANHTLRKSDLNPALVGQLQSQFQGAFYATANYDVGDTNAGAIATVACDPTSTDYTAIAGGVQ